MNILKTIIRGASSQFGREFGRAGANVILKGANSYTVKGVNTNKKTEQSDTLLLSLTDEIKSVKFESSNKGNTSKLIEITDLVISNLSFNGNETLDQLIQLNKLVNQYHNKFNHGSSLIDNDFADKSVDYLGEKRDDFLETLAQFNKDSKEFIDYNLQLARKKRKSKVITTILAFPVLGAIGTHKFYLGQIGQGILYLLFSFLLLPALIALIEFIQYLIMPTDEFDARFNPEYSYYKQFEQMINNANHTK